MYINIIENTDQNGSVEHLSECMHPKPFHNYLFDLFDKCPGNKMNKFKI